MPVASLGQFLQQTGRQSHAQSRDGRGVRRSCTGLQPWDQTPFILLLVRLHTGSKLSIVMRESFFRNSCAGREKCMVLCIPRRAVSFDGLCEFPPQFKKGFLLFPSWMSCFQWYQRDYYAVGHHQKVSVIVISLVLHALVSFLEPFYRAIRKTSWSEV